MCDISYLAEPELMVFIRHIACPRVRNEVSRMVWSFF